jgi:predicted nucleic acid-binding protein
MNNLFIFDTSVLVEDFRTSFHAQRMAALDGVIRISSVVLAELWRGVSTGGERDALQDLERNHPILIPSTKNWLDSGRILKGIRSDRGFQSHKLRDLHFDVLIALTARSHGARLITSNRTDFELIRKYKPFELEIWPSG